MADQMHLDDAACSQDQLQLPNTKGCLDYDRAISYDELLKAAKQCDNGVKWKSSVTDWMFAAQTNIAMLRAQLVDGTYKLGPYILFKISDPKPRIICSTRFRDRIVQRSLCNNGLYDALTKPLIYDCGACLKGKGLTFSLNRLETHLRKYFRKNKTNIGYYLKLDIKKFFDSTPHEVLKEKIKKTVLEKNFQQHVINIIDSFKDMRPKEVIDADPFGKRGIGLGSQISQLMQLLFLSDLDHMIKEKFKIKGYVRYMDDMILIHEDYNYLCLVKKEIAKYLTTIGLQLNPKSRGGHIERGIKFLKVRFTLTKTGKVKRKLARQAMNRELRRIRVLLRMLFNSQLSAADIIQHFNTWYGCNKWRMQKRQMSIVNKFVKKMVTQLKAKYEVQSLAQLGK